MNKSYKIGDTVKHLLSGRVAIICGVRKVGRRNVYRLNFGQSVSGPFGIELNNKEFVKEALI